MKKQGFSLLEMAVVMIIVSLIIGGLLMPLSSQLERQRIKATDDKLSQATEALIAFAVVNGRLPCPATADSHGVEDFVGGVALPRGGECKAPYNGYLPAVTLGLTGTKDGFWLDGWAQGDASRIRYAVAQVPDEANNRSPLTALGDPNTTIFPAFSGLGMSKLLDYFAYQNDPSGFGANDFINQGIRVCRSADAVKADDCGSGQTLANSALFVVYSLGKTPQNDGKIPARSSNEKENIDGDRVFVSAPYGAEVFDDQIQWVSSPLLFNRMIAAGKLQ